MDINVPRIPLETQALYAELLEQLAILEVQRSIGSLTGGFTLKKIKCEYYVYFQYFSPGGNRQQKYVGKLTPVLQSMIDQHQQEKDFYQADLQSIHRLCTQVSVGGGMTIPHAPFRVLQSLANSGVFRLGGVLVGTHAFSVIGNMLGFRWESAGLMTHDIDISIDRNLSVAIPSLPNTDIPETLEQLKMGFSPVPKLNLKNPSTSYRVRNSPLRLDLLTPSRTRDEDYKSVPIKQLKAAAQALHYLDYLIEGSMQAVALSRKDGTLVNVPDPARFALHKLIIAQERPAIEHAKRNKDYRQASLLIDLLIEERPSDLQSAWSTLKNHGESWTEKALTGYQAALRNPRFAPVLSLEDFLQSVEA